MCWLHNVVGDCASAFHLGAWGIWNRAPACTRRLKQTIRIVILNVFQINQEKPIWISWVWIASANDLQYYCISSLHHLYTDVSNLFKLKCTYSRRFPFPSIWWPMHHPIFRSATNSTMRISSSFAQSTWPSGKSWFLFQAWIALPAPDGLMDWLFANEYASERIWVNVVSSFKRLVASYPCLYCIIPGYHVSITVINPRRGFLELHSPSLVFWKLKLVSTTAV